MEENHAQPPDPHRQDSEPRRFVYRSVRPEIQHNHPLRRSTDTPQAFAGTAGQLCPRPFLVKMRVYLTLN
jgi:hypothetical protein